MDEDFERIVTPQSEYLLHVRSSTIIDFASPLGALVEHGLGTARPDLLTLARADLLAAAEQYELLTDMRPSPIPDAGMPISQVAISPTLSCNLNCSYCYNYQESEPEKIRALPSITEEVADKIFNTLSELQLGDELTFGFLGGALLNIDILNKLVERAIEFCCTRDIRPGFLVTTNGMTLGVPKVREFITTNRAGVYISIDGPKEWHDEARKNINGKESHDQLLKNISTFFDYYELPLRSARATVRLLPGRIIGTYRYLRDIGFNDIGWGSGDFETADLSQIETAAILAEIEELGNEFVDDLISGEVSRHSWFSEIFSLLYLGVSKQSICGATRNHVGFDVLGGMQPCHRYFGNGDFQLTVNDIRAGSDSKLIADIRAGGKTADCAKCWARGLCGGECFHVARVIGRLDDHVSRQRYICNFKRQKYRVAIDAYMRIWSERPDIIHKMFNKSYVGKAYQEGIRGIH